MEPPLEERVESEELVWLSKSLPFIDGGGLWMASQVCTTWRTLLTENKDIWVTAVTQLYDNLIGRYLVGDLRRAKAIEDYSWRQRWAIELREIRKFNKSARIIDQAPSAVLVTMFSLLPGWSKTHFKPKAAVKAVEERLSVARTLSVIGCVDINDVVHNLDDSPQTIELILESLSEYSPHTHISSYRRIIASAMQSLHCFFLAASTSFALDDSEDYFDCAHDIQVFYIVTPLRVIRFIVDDVSFDSH
eukprot:TRINITY_DN1610_c0_g1_i10.p1 TRINITY_DN1610_c0_g1~~TRINITY_DN1610_c0_g1_i10.p1  ORF type:complete len:247 (+),score=23.26 TRINITY_DN1610_c0_g1_i10:62-802(+)